MSEETRLDITHAAMQADLDDDAARMAFYQAVADAELFLLLEGEPDGATIEPELLDMDGDRFALVFDTDWRLSNFTQDHLPGEAMPYAALPGRVIAGLLKGRKIGIGLNLGVAPSSILIPDAALEWLSAALAQAPRETDQPIASFEPPGDLPDPLVPALVAKLGDAGGAAGAVVLARARFADGADGLIVGFIAPIPGTEQALARTVQEALVFSGIDNLTLEVGFFAPGSNQARGLETVGQAIALPLPPEPQTPATPPAPGTDPDKPPRLV